MNPVELNIFASRLESVCDEMGVILRNAAFSPNIKDRLDFSCAVFDPQGGLCAQAAHIPVHLGSMAFAMRDLVGDTDWSEGDMVIVNDPYLGGTHLPDVTLIAPVFFQQSLAGFVVNRAHHADIGSATPGSMPLSHRLEEEGIVIPPTLLISNGELIEGVLDGFLSKLRNPRQGKGDFSAQISANLMGIKRVLGLIEPLGMQGFFTSLDALNDYAERLACSALADIPDGRYEFSDLMDDDGLGHVDIEIKATVTVCDAKIDVDFNGSSEQMPGNINCPLSVAAAGVYYALRCLMPQQTPACAGTFRPISLSAPKGCLLNAERPAAVVAGNVETSTRVVDVVLGALAKAIPDHIPAASHGSMNNLAMGSDNTEKPWDYYETMGGGMGAGKYGGGLSAAQTHMTNTLNTPIEVVEMNYPVRVSRYQIRRGSGGTGQRPGGEGVIREFQFLACAQVTLLTERRRHAPWGALSGGEGKRGENCLNGEVLEGGKQRFSVVAGDRVTVKTPGGGGYGLDTLLN